MSIKNDHLDTLQLHAGQTANPTTGSRAVPIHQTDAFEKRIAAYNKTLA
jgi:O-acetylhomoserine (thiol)-lyase